MRISDSKRKGLASGAQAGNDGLDEVTMVEKVWGGVLAVTGNRMSAGKGSACPLNELLGIIT